MQLHDLTEVLEEIAPTRNAESWDNAGLLVGDPGQDVSCVLLAIDYTEPVAEEGQSEGCDAVIASHPPIFQPLRHVRFGNVIYDAIRRGVAIYSPHTALDVAEGGTNDVLGDAVGLASPASASARSSTRR